MPAVLRVVLLVSDLPREGSAKLGQSAEVGIELEGDDALVLPVVVTEGIPAFRQLQSVDGVAVVEVERHANQQIGNRIDDALDRQSLHAAPEGAVSALDQRRAALPRHGPITLPAERAPAA